MKAKILGLLAVGLLAGSPAANAVVVGAGDSLLWNFDVTGQTQPWFQVIWRTSYVDFGNGDVGRWDFYDGLNGTGTYFSASDVGLSGLGSTSSFNQQMWDGIFSARLTMSAGSVSVRPCAQVTYSNAPATECFAGTLVGSTFPEPGTLALLGLGLAGLGLSRRRRAA